MIRKHIYQWHRISSLIIAIPVLLWALSGFMHPLMTNIKPQVATQFLKATPVDSSKIRLPLQKALAQNHVDLITNVRLVHIDTNWFYQVQQGHNEPLYLSTQTGKLLPQGEWLYAQYLAKEFLEGQTESNQMHDSTHRPAAATVQDCCDAAATCVLNNTKGAQVKDVSTLQQFNKEYKSINKLLPVHRVSFNRADGIRIYVETTQDRFAFAMDNKRAIFDTLFQWLHTWSFLDGLGKGKLWLEIFFTILAFTTTIMGLYIFVITKSKKVTGNSVVQKRRNHRFTSVVASLFTLMFTFSGAYHALSKLKESAPSITNNEHSFVTKDIHFNWDSLATIVQKPITNIALVHMHGQDYWQVNTKVKPLANNHIKPNLPTDPKKALAPAPAAIYVHSQTYAIVPNGELAYATYLASLFSQQPTNSIVKMDTIRKFEGEYGFVNKRLPVFKISYSSNHNERYYVETATGQLALKIDDTETAEGYSFSFLHKHHFLDVAGKAWRDFSTMFWAAMQVAMVVVGLVLYFHSRKKGKQAS